MKSLSDPFGLLAAPLYLQALAHGGHFKKNSSIHRQREIQAGRQTDIEEDKNACKHAETTVGKVSKIYSLKAFPCLN